MGKLNTFDITYENPQAVYHAGQAVNGYVTVDLNAPMKMRGIRIKFYGSAYVHWTERHSTGSGKNRRTHTRHYSATEIYFNHLIVLFGKAPNQSGPDPELAAGRYTYPFSFSLMPNLPSSFEGAWGYVRYFTKATIDKPWKFDHDTKRCFTILSVLDLNREPSALTPQESSDEKVLCCWCCASGPITARISIPRTGYVPGESITINAQIDNRSSRKMDKSSVILSQSIAFKATTKTRWATNKVAAMTKGEIAPMSSDQWVNAQLKIPAIPPSDLVGCNIIDIKYILTLEVDPSGPSLDLDIPLGILIGTIPPQAVVAAHYAGGNYDLQRDYFNTAPPPTASAPPPEDMLAPPPSYESCYAGPSNVRDETDSEFTMGNLEYTPAYTYYDWNKAPAV